MRNNCHIWYAMVFLFTFHSLGETISISILFENFHCEIVENIHGALVIIDGIPSISRVGAPHLPAIPVRIALPSFCTAVSIKAVETTYTGWRSVSKIMPVSLQIPISQPWLAERAQPDPEVYQADAFYPEKALRFSGSGVIWGIPIATAIVHPVRWNPVSGELERLVSMEFELEIQNNPAGSTVSRRSHTSELQAIDLVRKIVINPEGVSSSGAFLVDERDLEYGQYVIICPPEYEDEMQVLADWKTSKGIPSAVYTTDWITANYSFIDLQQETRAFLTDCRTEGTDYVLLAGDDDVLEARQVMFPSLSYERPSDLYFVDINDTYPGQDNWNSNSDEYWGNHDDTVEWHPDLWVGRASVNSNTEAELFVNKVLFYEHVIATWSTGVQRTAPVEMRIGYSTGMMSEGPSVIWGSAGAEYVSEMIPSSWQQEKRYESENNNSSTITVEMINMGMNQIYHSSHGGYWSMYTSYGSIIDTTDVLNLTNISSGQTVSIWNSIACLTGAFDSLTCCADAWLNSPNGGGFGAFNTNYGYYSSNPGQGISDLLIQRFFHEYLINDIFNLGIAHAMGTDFFCPPDWCSATEEVVKGYTLFGDPELPMWTEEPVDITAMYPGSITGNATINVTVTSQGAALEGARVCIQKGSWQTGEVYDVAVTDASGLAQVWASPQNTMPIDITIWAHNHNLHTGQIQVLETGINIEPELFLNSLESVFPNPASGSVSVSYSIAEAESMELAIFDMQGRVIETLASGECIPGNYTCSWEIDDRISSGLYLIRLSAGSFRESVSLVVLK